MVFDAHARAFEFLRGVCTRGIYDNMKTAVEAVFIGKDRQFNRRFLQMCGHYLVEPTACTPASGWEKGQVENQVGNLRERLFTPRLRVTSYDELNAWLLDRCVAYAKANRHPELTDQTIWQVFEVERAKLVPITGRRTSRPLRGSSRRKARTDARDAVQASGAATHSKPDVNPFRKINSPVGMARQIAAQIGSNGLSSNLIAYPDAPPNHALVGHQRRKIIPHRGSSR